MHEVAARVDLKRRATSWRRSSILQRSVWFRMIIAQSINSAKSWGDLPAARCAAFWGFLAVVLMTITLLMNQGDTGNPGAVTRETIIERVAQPPSARTTPTKRPPPRRASAGGAGPVGAGGAGLAS